MSANRIIHSEQAPRAIGPYSQAVRAGGFVFCSGQLPVDPATGEMVTGDVRAAAARALDNLAAVLAAAGLELRDAVKVTVFLADMADFGAVNEVYAGYFPSDPPARACVQVARLPGNAPLEIELVAACKRES